MDASFALAFPRCQPRSVVPMDENNEIRKSEELRSFLFLTVVMVPVLTVMIIAAYGFAVWFYQMLIGGPPHH